MLKAARFEKDEKFLTNLAKAAEPQPKTIKVTAQELELPDDAVQAAQAYWLQGWSWEEIEATLMDSEYTEAEIKRAMKEISEYAEKVHKEGPFATSLSAGQRVRLRSGMVAELVSYSPKNLLIDDGQDRYVVTPDQIDFEATKQLREASRLRSAAEALIAAPKKKEKPKDEPAEDFARKPDPEETHKFTFPEKAPTGWRDVTPEKGQLPKVDTALAAMIAQLKALRDIMDQRHAEITEIKQVMVKPLEQKNKEEAVKYQELVQAVFRSLDEEFEALDALDKVIFMDYEDKILGLRRTAVELQYPPTTDDKFTFVMDYLREAHPKIIKDTEEALAKFEKSNTKIKDMIENVGAVYKYKGSKRAQVLTRVVDWVKDVWRSIQQGVGLVFSGAVPAAQEASDQIDEYLAQAKIASVRVTYANALESMRRAHRASQKRFW